MDSRSASASDSMMKYVLEPNDSSLAATNMRLAAYDSLSILVFTTSADMHRLFAAISIQKS
jgi:hypothetical protein